MNLRILYLFAGPRRQSYEKWKQRLEPDTYLVGLNHLANHGIKTDFLENFLTEWLRRISFNLTQLPVILVLHSYDIIFSGSGIFMLFLVKYVLRLKKPKWAIYNTYLSNLLKRNQKGLKAWIIRKAVWSADAIISPSLAQKNYLTSVGFPPEKNFYVPYGVDYDFYNHVSEGKNPIEGRYIFSAGRDVGRDYKTLIEAVKDLPIRLVVAALPRNLADVGPLPANVTVSYFKPSQMPTLYRGAEFVVIPTIPEEKMAGSDCSGQYVLLESMSVGKAVITSERFTLSDYFTSGIHGVTVPPEDIAALREAIMDLWNDPTRAKSLGERGREKVKENFTMEVFSNKLAKIFHEVADMV
jgi:glycosyltransferase involved in cell wall biosynthesis